METDNKIMRYYFDLECELHKDTYRSIEVKAAEAWGVLTAACKTGEIDWDSQRMMFGELMSRMLKLR